MGDRCPNCEEPIDPDWTTCKNCGEPLLTREGHDRLRYLFTGGKLLIIQILAWGTVWGAWRLSQIHFPDVSSTFIVPLVILLWTAGLYLSGWVAETYFGWS